MQTIELVALSNVLGGTAATAAAAPASAAASQPSTERVELPGGGWKTVTTWPGGQMIQISSGNGMFSSFSFSSSQIFTG